MMYLETPSGTELDTETAVRFYMDSEAEAGPLHQCMGMCIKNDVKVKPAIILTILGVLLMGEIYLMTISRNIFSDLIRHDIFNGLFKNN